MIATLGRTAVLGIAVTAALVATTGTASAATAFSPTYTLATGWTCAGEVSGTAIPGPSDYSAPGEAAVYLRGTFWSATPGSHQSGCSVTATVDWRNLDTGASGSTATVVVGGPFGETGPATGVLLPTGPGRVEATVSTAPLLHHPGQATFTVDPA
ncbi:MULTISPECIES: hypothetical protein [unclassified Nocardia]|uniref:hypothetical protein n=1 Tax=unclassified Nocardia TaxID=2637762 RepID=UPI00278BCC76|nr:MULTISPECIES: hypothetical protein [unclassified Nocardia]